MYTWSFRRRPGSGRARARWQQRRKMLNIDVRRPRALDGRVDVCSCCDPQSAWQERCSLDTRGMTQRTRMPQFALRAASVAVLRPLACPPCFFLLGGRDGRRESTCACTLSRRGTRALLPCRAPPTCQERALKLGAAAAAPARAHARRGGPLLRSPGAREGESVIRRLDPFNRRIEAIAGFGARGRGSSGIPLCSRHQQTSAARMRRIGQWLWPWTRLQTPHCFDFPPRETNRLDLGVASGCQIVGLMPGGAQAANIGADDMMSHQRFTAWRGRRQICHVR